MSGITKDKLIKAYKYAISTGDVFILKIIVDRAIEMGCLKEVLSNGSSHNT